MITQNHSLNHQKERSKGKELFHRKSEISPILIRFDQVLIHSKCLVRWDSISSETQSQEGCTHCHSTRAIPFLEFLVHFKLQGYGAK
jgi:hypothetical protein